MRIAGTKFEVLKVREFRLFFIGNFTSMLGDEMTAPALAFAILLLTHSAGDVGVVMAARVTALIVFLLIGGMLADRLPRSVVMRSADVVRVGTQGLTALLLISGTATLWELVLLQLVQGAASAMFKPAITGLMRDIVTDADQRASANALRGLAQSVMSVAGPLVAVGLVISVGAGWAIAADAGTYGVSAVCLWRIRTTASVAVADRSKIVSELLVGWHAFRSRTWVWSVIVVASLSNMVFAALMVIGPTLALNSWHDPKRWGFFLAAIGVGASVGAFAALHLRPSRPMRLATSVFVLAAAPALVMSRTSEVVAVVAAGFATGVAMMIFNPLWENSLQAHIPPGVLSRVSAYEWIGSYLAQPIGMLVAAPAMALAGASGTLLAFGLMQVVLVPLPLLSRELRSLRPAPAEQLPVASAVAD